jgi:glycosyltransferase involved in cell wall biosynthesis
VDGFVAVSEYYGRVMAERLSLDRARLKVAHNGIDLAGFVPAEAPDDPPTVGYLARMCADKGLDTLIEAFIELARRKEQQGLRLRVCGAMLPQDRALVSDCQKRLADAGLADRVTWHANIDRQEKLRLLRGLTVFSVPATYGESFGLYVLEAMASGVPVVQPDHAAFGELIGATGGGLLCAPDDPAALADRLAELLNDPARAAALGRAGREAVMADFGDEPMARRVAGALTDLIARSTDPTMVDHEPALDRPAHA